MYLQGIGVVEGTHDGWSAVEGCGERRACTDQRMEGLPMKMVCGQRPGG